jgi:hypothetical protein
MPIQRTRLLQMNILKCDPRHCRIVSHGTFLNGDDP